MSSLVPCPVRQHAQASPDQPAIISAGQRLSFAQCDEVAQVFSESLKSNGVKKKDVVLLHLPPSAENVLLIWALFRTGAFACPVNPNFPNAYLQDVIEQINPAHIISDRDINQRAVLRLHEIVGHKLDEPKAPDRLLDMDKPSSIILSSGSSGPPKAIVHSLRNHVASANRSNRNIALAPGDCWLLSLPLYHISGLATIIRCFVAGAALGVPEHRGALSEALEQLPVTHLSLVPTQLQDLLNDATSRERLARCKAILLGGSAIPERLIHDAIAAGIPVHTTYGLTEMASQVCTTPPHANLDTLLTAGMPLEPGTLKLDEQGLIMVGGETLFKGYWRAGQVVPPELQDSYFATGDLGRIDDQGRLIVNGRRDNMFISGGENIQPEEIERAIGQYPSVRGVVCVPVVDARLGFVPAVFIDAAEPVSNEILGAYLASRLPKFAIPWYVLPWQEHWEAGIKISRKSLIERAAALIVPDQKSGK